MPADRFARFPAASVILMAGEARACGHTNTQRFCCSRSHSCIEIWHPPALLGGGAAG